MKKIILSLIAVITLTVHANPVLEPIPGASYVIFKAGSKLSAPKTATFYSFDGNEIITVPTPLAYACYWKINRLRLDPSAPKPEAVTYAIRSSSKKFNSGKSTIFFYDKNDNVIAEIECHKKSNSFSILFTDPTVKPGHIGQFTRVTAPDWASLKEILISMKSFPLEISRVVEKSKHSKKLK